MCGIAGFFNSNMTPEEQAVTIEKMLELIVHRGPDEMGFYSDNYLTFGNTRLSIIDLKSGQQPLCDHSRRYWICYNGEVYNYKELAKDLSQQGYSLRTHSDTEVVLYAWIAWGPKAFERLNGAFAIAIYDSLEKSLILVRDRYGKRPLYYSQQASKNTLLFASELKSFLAYPNISFQFDEKKLASIFYLWTPLSHETAFQNFSQLPEGCYLKAIQGHVSIHAYTELKLNQPLYAGSEEEAADHVYSLLQESVRLRMRSDVDIGLYLSGGLDSAIVSKLAIQESRKTLHSFSIAFEDKAYDESFKQQLLSDYLGTHHTTLRINYADIVAAFPFAVWHAEVPQFRTALVPMYLLAQKVKEQKIKVVLTGEGSDEAFLGYDIFKETLLRQLLKDSPESEEIKIILNNLYPYLQHFKEGNTQQLLAVYRQHLTENTPGIFSHELRFYNSNFAMRLFSTPLDPLEEIRQLLKDFHDKNLSAVQQAQWLEFKTLLAGYLLSSQGDRMSLAHGIEGRCPFLDPQVVNFAASLPQEFKLKNKYQEKHILKQAFKNKLPSSILEQPKQPYRAPDAAAFFSGTLPDYVEWAFSKEALQDMGYLNPIFCQQLFNKLKTKDPNSISPRENQVFINVISLSLLHQFFINRKFPASFTKLPQKINKFSQRDKVYEN